MSRQLYDILRDIVGAMRIRQDEPMKNHTTFRVGGPARYFVSPADASELAAVLDACRSEGSPLFTCGNGSTLLVSDQGFPGTVVDMGRRFTSIRTEGEKVFFCPRLPERPVRPDFPAWSLPQGFRGVWEAQW